MKSTHRQRPGSGAEANAAEESRRRAGQCGVPRLAALAALIWLASFDHARAQGTAFTYQGRLAGADGPATGLFDLQLRLFAGPDPTVAPNPLAGPVVIEDVGVTNGLFTALIDFEAASAQLDGSARWLEIGVRPAASAPEAAFATLSPRQALTATPYAIQAGRVPASGILGTIADSALPANVARLDVSNQVFAGSVTFANATGKFTGDGSNLRDLHGTNLVAGTIPVDRLRSESVLLKRITLSVSESNPAEAPQFFGAAVATLGDGTLAVGDPGEDPSFNNFPGMVYLFGREGNLTRKIPFPDTFIARRPPRFGSAIAGLGTDRFIVKAEGIGEVYLFHRDGTKLIQFPRPEPYVASAGVAVVGPDLVATGVSGNGVNLSRLAVLLYRTNGTVVREIRQPFVGADTGNLNFGVSVAGVGTDKLVIGARGKGTLAGQAYLFSTNGTLLASFSGPPGPNPTPASRSFGSFVTALGDGRVLVGDPDATVEGGGRVYVFSLDGTLLATLNNPAPESVSDFGASAAALDDQQVLVGSRYGAFPYSLTRPVPQVGTIIAPQPPATAASSLVVGGVASGTVLIGDPTHNRVHLYAPTGKHVTGLVAEQMADSTTVAALLTLGREVQILQERVKRLESTETGHLHALSRLLFELSNRLVPEVERINGFDTSLDDLLERLKSLDADLSTLRNNLTNPP